MADCLSSLHACAGITGISVEADAKKRRFLAAARNEGARLSKSDSVFFLDDDNVVDSQAVLELMKAFTLDNMIAVASPVIYYKADQTRFGTGEGGFRPSAEY